MHVLDGGEMQQRLNRLHASADCVHHAPLPPLAHSQTIPPSDEEQWHRPFYRHMSRCCCWCCPQACCSKYHAGTARASTPEQLLRARYSAYCIKDPTYIADTTHTESSEYVGSSASYLRVSAYLGLRAWDWVTAARCGCRQGLAHKRGFTREISKR